jgi:hypothetical protein
MDTPDEPQQDPHTPLYGAAGESINRFGTELTRRTLIGAALALPIAAHAQAADDPVERAMRAMGGRELLARVTALRWYGKARISDAGRTVDMTLTSHVEPFGRVRTDSWLTLDSSTIRSMILTPEGGYVQRGQNSTPMDAAEALYHRQQYAVFSYLLLAQPGTNVTADAGRIAASHQGLPSIRFTLDSDGSIAAADYSVASPDGVGIIAEHIRFDGKLSDKGVNWPQQIIVLQNAMPYMTLTLDSFGVELA